MLGRTFLGTIGAMSCASVIAFAAALGPAAADDGDEVSCDDRLAEIDALIEEYDMDIPSGALNDIFTLEQQAEEACVGGSNELALTLIDDLEELVHESVEEGIPTVSPDDADLDIGDMEEGELGDSVIEDLEEEHEEEDLEGGLNDDQGDIDIDVDDDPLLDDDD